MESVKRIVLALGGNALGQTPQEQIQLVKNGEIYCRFGRRGLRNCGWSWKWPLK